jgi:gamma-glutamyltranspeptidase/glutathione hydrolase
MPAFITRPVVMGRNYALSSGHYLASAAGARIFAQGGNAYDAAAAMCLCLNLLEPQSNGLGGEVPVLLCSAAERRVFAVSGQGWSPAALTLDWCRAHGVTLIPGDGFIPACVPAVIGTWTEILARFGTLSFAQVAAPAIELAEQGFPVYEQLHESLAANAAKFTERYPTTAEVYCPHGRAPETGELLRNPAWAETLKLLCHEEQAAAAQGRSAGLEAARKAFYEGALVERILDFITTHEVPDESGAQHKGLLSYDDFAEWRAVVEEPVSLEFAGLTVHKCPPWSQGPVFLQQLALLSGYDLAALEHNSTDYLHTLTECAKLAFADREAYYGDPAFDSVPLDVLLSPEYAESRRHLVAGCASAELIPGRAGINPPDVDYFNVAADNARALGLEPGTATGAGHSHAHIGDTTYLCAADAQGNLVSATPSGGWIGSSPVIPALGFPLGTRAQMFYLNPARPNALQPRKRPRTTLTPTLVTRNGAPLLAFGTPGGDSQDQWTLQFFLNHTVFGMNLQAAIDAPTVHSEHFPSSFYPRQAYPRRVAVEGRIPSEVLAALEQRGHELVSSGGWAHGKVQAVRIDSDNGVLSAAASPRRGTAYALAW